MCRPITRLALALFAVLGSVSVATAIPVVPGAVGFGMDTRAAYACGANPTVIKVTSLADTNTVGTLRYALLQTIPRIIVFETSGYIDITSDINVISPCLTIAGQTAPSPGITVRMSAGLSPEKIIVINAHDVLIQHIRFRPGGTSCNSGPLIVYSYLDTGDGQGTVPHTLFYNVILDHVSMSWGQDEGLYAGRTDLNGGNANVTFWRTLAAEGLWNAPGTSPPACGGTLGDEPANGHGIFIEGRQVDVIQSVMAVNRERNPMLDTNFASRLLNNIIYGWQGEWGIFAFNKYNYGPWSLTAIGNRFIVGPQTNSNTNVGGAVQFWWGAAYQPSGTGEAGNQAYLLDNGVTNTFGATIFPTNQGHGFGQLSYNPVVASPPAAAPIPNGYVPIDSAALEAYLMPKVGARPLNRDAVDTRIVAYIAARGGAFIQLPSDVGGYPALAVNTQLFTTVASPHTNAGDGYTNLEHQLHDAADLLEGNVSVPVPADVPDAAGANVVVAHFTGASTTALTAYTSDTGGGWTFQTGSTGILQLDTANRLLNNSTGVTSATMSNATPLSAEYDVIGDLITTATLTANTEYALWGRASTTAQTGYFFSIDPSAGMAYLRLANAGSYSLLGSCAHTFAPSTTYHIILRMRNAGPHAVIDGTQCTASADATLGAAGKAGLSAFAPTAVDDATHGARWDEFIVKDVTAVSNLTITTLSVPNAVLTHVYATTLAATGGSGAKTWSISAGALPTGLSLGSSSGTISGTPTLAGTYVFTVRITDAISTTTTQSLSIVAQPAISITSGTALPEAERNSGYSVPLVSAGDQAPIVWIVSAGTLPPGLIITPATGIISGTPTALGTSSFTLRATGALGSTVTKAVTLTVSTEYRPPTRPISRNQAEGVVFRRPTQPTNPADSAMRGDLWVNTSDAPPTMYVCISATATTAVWTLVP